MIDYDTLYDVYEQYMHLRKHYNTMELQAGDLIIERSSREYGA